STFWKSLEPVSFDVLTRPGLSIVRRGWLGLRYHTTGWAVWIQAVVARARALHRQTPFDLVISRSLPNQAHLAGYWVASTLGIPWVANFNDPWALSPFVPSEAGRKDWTPTLSWRLWLRRVLRCADAVTFPCERLRDRCLQNTPHRKVFIVPHIGIATPR